jgi:hypothetical protein
MTDLLENNTQGAVSWRYYSDTSIGANPQGNLWTAPNAIEHICLPSGGNCTGPDWPGQTNYNGKITLKPPQILTDLGAVAGKPCNLQQVSWVIPDGSWSDHPGTVGAGRRPFLGCCHRQRRGRLHQWRPKASQPMHRHHQREAGSLLAGYRHPSYLGRLGRILRRRLTLELLTNG